MTPLTEMDKMLQQIDITKFKSYRAFMRAFLLHALSNTDKVVRGLHSVLKNGVKYANEENDPIELTPPLGNGELPRHWSAAAFEKNSRGSLRASHFNNKRLR